MSRRICSLAFLASTVLAACHDGDSPTGIVGLPSPNASAGRGWFQRYVAIGTSVTMGWMSDGVSRASQLLSWPAQLARMANREMSLPGIAEPGCKAPFAAPLISFKRTSGESVATPEAALTCAPNEAGVTLPAQNLGLPSATAGDVLARTPELQTNPFLAKLYGQVLPPGETQISAFEKLNPKFASVEVGPNDILGTLSGAVIPGVTFVPFAVWAAQYDQILDRVLAITKRGVLVGLGRDIGTLPTVRRGNELWTDRAAFLGAFNVEVNADCNGSQNLLVVPVVVPTAVATGLGRKAAGLSPFVLSCTEGASTAQDRILTPAEVATVNAAAASMNEHIRTQATARGYAYFELDALYGLPKDPFSVVTLMTGAAPYGPNISLDGLHPSAAGSGIIAAAAAQAIDATYNLGLTAMAGTAMWHR